jgi:hypothetical protein
MHGIGTVTSEPVEIPDSKDVGFSYDFLGLSNALVADGWATIYPALVGDVRSAGQAASIESDWATDPSGTGAHYVELVLAWWDHVVSYARRTIGYNCPIVPIGFSLGAWHALQVAINKASTIVAYAAAHPALQWEPIFNQAAGSLSSLDLASSALNGVTIPGWLGWGTADTTVDPAHSGDTFTPAMYAAALAAGAPVTPNCNGTCASSGGTPEVHIFTSTDRACITSWMTATVDPLCPKVF